MRPQAGNCSVLAGEQQFLLVAVHGNAMHLGSTETAFLLFWQSALQPFWLMHGSQNSQYLGACQVPKHLCRDSSMD